MQKIDAQKVFEASSVLFMSQFPERDGKHLPLDTFEAYENGAAKDIDFLIGCNKDEMNFFVYSFGLKGWNTWAADRKAKKFAQFTDAEKKLAESFCNDMECENWERDSRLFSQIWFNAPVIWLAESQTQGGGKSYAYYFTPEAALPIMKCGHAIELAVVFNHPDMTGDTGREFDATFCKTMRKMWVHFAKTGNPSLSAEISSDGKAKDWSLYDTENKPVMVFDEFNIHSEKESALKIIDWDRTYPLTKYYMI